MEEVLVVTFIDASSTKRILDKCFDLAPGGTLELHNKYFHISVSLRVVSDPEADGNLSDDRGKIDLARCPAIVLLSPSEPGTISKCQNVWDKIHGTLGNDAVRILLLEGDNLDEKQTYEIVTWGLRTKIEVVNSLLCKEDEIEIPIRLKRILECSPWPSICHDEDRESKKDDTTRCETREASGDDFNLSKPTSLRRGLHQSDLTRLMNDLVLADESDSDD